MAVVQNAPRSRRRAHPLIVVLAWLLVATAVLFGVFLFAYGMMLSRRGGIKIPVWLIKLI